MKKRILMNYCCKSFKESVEGWKNCKQHKDPFDCPDALICCSEKGYGIIVHDGGPSFMLIKYCPFCGQKLASYDK